MSEEHKISFAIIKLFFMIVLLTFISPFIFDFSSDSLEKVFSEVYNHADNQTKENFADFVETNLCVPTKLNPTDKFSHEMALFCQESDEQKDTICLVTKQRDYEFYDQICNIYNGDDFETFCETAQTTREVADVREACGLLDENNITAGDFFLLYSKAELEVVEKDVFDDGSVHDAALDTLKVPKLLRLENYLVWQRILVMGILTILLYFAATGFRTLTHKLGHVFVQTGAFLVIYRLIIAGLIKIFGINTSYLFEVIITSNGSVTFSEILSEVFFSLFLLMHTIFYQPTYWIVSFGFIGVGLLLYIPWFLQKRKTKSADALN